MSQKEFDRFTRLGHHDMNLETIEISFLAGNEAPIHFLAIVQFAVLDAVVVANGNWKRIDAVNTVDVQCLPLFRKQSKQGKKVTLNPM